VCEVLRTYGALDEWEATDFGELVAELAGDNELWLALVMIELADRDELLPEQLAAILATTLDERMRPNAYIGYQTSDTVLEVVDELQARADTLTSSQYTAGVDFPVTIEAGVCSIVEAWAGGEEWGALVANTSLDQGDIYRILRRSLELLRSITSVPYVSRGVQRRAAAGVRAMNRYPLSDNSLMGVGADPDESPASPTATQQPPAAAADGA